MTKTFVYATFRLEGVHHWPDTAGYLRHPHRHIFHFKVSVEVTHGDREVEFIALRSIAQLQASHILHGKADTSVGVLTLSCEQIAQRLLKFLRGYYIEEREYIIEVSEDGENGAILHS